MLVATARDDFLASCITAAAGESKFVKGSVSARQVLYAIAVEAVQNSATEVIEELVETSVTSLQASKGNMDSREAIIIDLLLRLSATSLSRTQREKILNALCKFHAANNDESEDQTHKWLALMVQLMEVPNATSTLSTDPNAIWLLAFSVNPDEYAGSGLESWAHHQILGPKTTVLLGELTNLVTRHLLATQDLERSQEMLIALSAGAEKVMEAISDTRHLTQHLSTHNVALVVVNSIIREMEAGAKVWLKQRLPHREPNNIARYLEWCSGAVTFLLEQTHDGESRLTSSKAESFLIGIRNTLRIMPESLNQSSKIDIGELTGRLVNAIPSTLHSMRRFIHEFGDGHGINVQALENSLVLCYAIGCEHDSSNLHYKFADLAVQLLDMPFKPTQYRDLMAAIEIFVQKLDSTSRLHLLQSILPHDGHASPSNLLLALTGIARLGRADVDQGEDPFRHRLLQRLLTAALRSESILFHRRAMKGITTVLKEKAFLINQYSIEATLTTMLGLLQNRIAASITYVEVCRIMSVLLLQYRSRLYGRFHLVINIFQRLVSQLFQNGRYRPSNQMHGKNLTLRHARALARLLSLFCEPPLLRRQTKKSELNDESRKEQAYVGQFVQQILHHFCGQVLNGSLAEGMREALTPGLWSMVEAIEINNADGIKSLSAAMNNSERAVLRGVYDDWKRFGKWYG